ncbi:hypothetical protein A0O28_0073260 [Trichoderma guizhouense]|uniref:Uncharacterized protein n=1 Tax=Trichoderma guizhouense TaxID=1491466 RepID=A0A1T3CVJ7_9HYPO|nr:hypothetical protein A0O28_0073260 [Trichoderma guizhouense]
MYLYHPPGRPKSAVDTSHPPLHFIIPSIVRHCSVIQTASSGSPATRDTSPGALIRPNTRTVPTRTPAGFHSFLVFWTLDPSGPLLSADIRRLTHVLNYRLD